METEFNELVDEMLADNFINHWEDFFSKKIANKDIDTNNLEKMSIKDIKEMTNGWLSNMNEMQKSFDENKNALKSLMDNRKELLLQFYVGALIKGQMDQLLESLELISVKNLTRFATDTKHGRTQELEDLLAIKKDLAGPEIWKKDNYEAIFNAKPSASSVRFMENLFGHEAQTKIKAIIGHIENIHKVMLGNIVLNVVTPAKPNADKTTDKTDAQAEEKEGLTMGQIVAGFVIVVIIIGGCGLAAYFLYFAKN